MFLICEIEFYVDDLKIFRFFYILEFEIVMLEIEEDFYRVVIWCCENYFFINLEKIKFFLFGM